MHKYFKYTSQWLLTNIFAFVAGSLIEIQYLITLEGSSFSSLSQAVFTDFFHRRLVLLVLGPKSWTACCVLKCLESKSIVVSFLFLFEAGSHFSAQAAHKLSIWPTPPKGWHYRVVLPYQFNTSGMGQSSVHHMCVSIGRISKGVFREIGCVCSWLCQMITDCLPGDHSTSQSLSST